MLCFYCVIERLLLNLIVIPTSRPIAMHRLFVFIISMLACFSWASPPVKAQKLGFVKLSPDERYGYFLETRKKVVRIPFDFYSNLIIVPVILNGTDSLRFILDTGVSSTIITDPSKISLEKMRFTRRVSLNGAGTAESVTARVGIGNTLKMDLMRANFQNVVVLDEDILKLSEFVGAPVHGIFGYEIFNNFAVTIDFAQKELVLTAPENYSYKKRKGELYPITVLDTKPFTDAVTMISNGVEYPIRVLIDTGSGHALLLDSHSNPKMLPAKVIDAQLGRGLSGVITGSIGRIDQVRLGEVSLTNVVTSFPDEEAYGAKLYNRSDRNGNIGCELLRRFRVTLNYRDGYMVLKPNKKKLQETFEHDMSGMELRAIGAEYKSFVVNNILADSPAEEAGLHIGDELIFINDRPAKSMSISDLYKLLQKGHGKKLNLLIKRDGGGIVFTQIKLRRMI